MEKIGMIRNKPVVGILPTYNLTNEANDPYQDRADVRRKKCEVRRNSHRSSR